MWRLNFIYRDSLSGSIIKTADINDVSCKIGPRNSRRCCNYLDLANKASMMFFDSSWWTSPMPVAGMAEIGRPMYCSCYNHSIDYYHNSHCAVCVCVCSNRIAKMAVHTRLRLLYTETPNAYGGTRYWVSWRNVWFTTKNAKKKLGCHSAMLLRVI